MGICQQKYLTNLSLGIVFSLTGAVSAKAATVSYEPVFNAMNNPSSPVVNFLGDYTLGYQFSVDPAGNDNNLEMTAFGVFASRDNLFVPDNPDDYFFLPNEQGFFTVPENIHEIGLWEVNDMGEPLNLDSNNVPIPLRRITIDPNDPENPGNPNPLLGYIDGFAYLALDDPDDPVTPDNELDDILTLEPNIERFFRLGVSYSDGSDQAWINDASAGPLFGEVIVPNENLDGVPNEGADVDPMLTLQPNLVGSGHPQGYYSSDPFSFPDQDVMLSFAPGNTPFFVAGNILFGPLPPSFPISGTTTGGTTTGGTTTGGTTTGGTTTGGTTTGGTTTGGTTTGGTTTGGTTTGGTTTGGTPTIPEPSLIHGLLAITLGGIFTRYKQGKMKR
ncbi:histidinol dehydrogenase [Cyanothece sp. BG0011]|uniref:histidinol dehydrogenase n=1 Tax=Cyanothece sp. BG0011 TaxID=2082950 RepID=UPI000D1FD127|nr:histidinol dehydrogenase [Cyanothece sp. BG0011]